MPKLFGRLYPISILLVVLLAVGAIFLLSSYRGERRSYLASLFFPERITTERLKERYRSNELTVLIVPGHDRKSWGTSFHGTKEVELTVALAEHLYQFLKADSHFRVFLTQDSVGYAPWVIDHAASHASRISSFRERVREAMYSAIRAGFEQKFQVYHPTAEPEVAGRLYGLNEWANDNGVDIVLHIHFNDYHGRNSTLAGRYTGFAIYIPEQQLPNARTSQVLARSVLAELLTILPVSNIPQEADGIIEDQELIAIGANASLDSSALLIEYGYIYEPQWMNIGTRAMVLKELAYRTYAGVVKHFDPVRQLTSHDSSILPYRWTKSLAFGLQASQDVFALQVALGKEGLYPPWPSNLRNCPITGNYFDCTKTAMAQFQVKYSDDIMRPDSSFRPSGAVGPLTITKLNALYGLRRD